MTVAGGVLAVLCATLAILLQRSGSARVAFAPWILATAAFALAFPDALRTWGDFSLPRAIVPLVQLIMFGMGATLTFGDFARVVRSPGPVVLGFCLQYGVMSTTAWLLARLWGLEGEMAAGLILFGSCAGGTASNVIAYLANANVALSVTMTACSTLLSPFVTPLLMEALAGRLVVIDPAEMTLSILRMILAPVVAGVLLNRFAPAYTQRLSRGLPAVSMFGICAVIGITIAASRDDLLSAAGTLFGAAVCHSAIGFLAGYAGARMLRLNERDARTVSIEVAMQNGGMATGLAFDVLRSPIAALASAVEGPWSGIVGALLASIWRGRDTGVVNSSSTAQGSFRAL